MASIVVVDDDVVLRSVLAEVLTYEGHTVRQAIDGAHALALVLGHPPDLVISDVVMPQLDGVALAVALAEHAPQVPMVLLSATCPPQRVLPVPCVPKPFATERLLALVDDLLVAKRPASWGGGPPGRAPAGRPSTRPLLRRPCGRRVPRA